MPNGVFRRARERRPELIRSESFESRLIAYLGQQRYSAQAIFDYMVGRGFSIVRSLSQIRYHLGSHRVSLKDQRSRINLEVPRMIRLKQA